MYRSTSSIFMTKPHPVVRKSIMKVPNQKLARQPKCCSFFKILWLFHNCFRTKQQHFTLSSALVITVSRGSLNRSLKNYGFICNTIFFTCMHAHNHLATKRLLFKIAEFEIWLCAWRQRESRSSNVDLVFEQSLVHDCSANTAYIYWPTHLPLSRPFCSRRT